MKTQLIGIWVSLTLHIIVAFFLYNISQGFSAGTRTLVLDLSLDAAGPPGKAGPPPISPQPAKPDPTPKPRVFKPERPKSGHQSPPLAPHRPEPKQYKPPRKAKDQAGPLKPAALATRKSQEMPAAPANPILARQNSRGDPPAGPETNNANISGEGGLSGGAGETEAENTVNKGGDSYLNAHLGFIRRRLRQSLRYPGIARQSGWSGNVLIAFTIHTDGLAHQIEIKKSCGIPLLDKSALATVRHACPFPKPPMAVRIIIPILYHLN